MEYQDSNDDSVLNDSDRLIHNEEILDFVLQFDLPIFLSIDTSLQNRAAVSSVSLVTPDIRPNDEDNEWHHRRPRTLITRAWKLPEHGEQAKSALIWRKSYSENARMLQRNIRNKSQHTHRAYIRRVKQGIDTALANHLEHLIAQWPREDRLNTFMRDTYE